MSSDWIVVDQMTARQLLGDLDQAANDERRSTAYVLPRIAEADFRKLYQSAGYPSMHAYCTRRLHYSDDAASKRIQAARKAREIPALFVALADGRLHLTAICLLAPHISVENAEELIAAATHRCKWEIQQWLRHRFAAPDLLAALATQAQTAAHAPAHTDAPSSEPQAGPDLRLGPESGGGSEAGSDDGADSQTQHAPAHVVESPVEASLPSGPDAPVPNLVLAGQETFPGWQQHAPAHVQAPPSWAPSTEWETIELQIKGWKLRYARELMSHALPSRSASIIYDRAIDLLIHHQEKRKFGLTRSPRGARRAGSGSRPVPQDPRSIPLHVRRAVWERDQGQCTLVAVDGTRCESRDYLEYDHIHPVAKGGKSTVDNLRLRCRAHNQYEAEQIFGADFMKKKREQKRRAREEKKRRRA